MKLWRLFLAARAQASSGGCKNKRIIMREKSGASIIYSRETTAR